MTRGRIDGGVALSGNSEGGPPPQKVVGKSKCQETFQHILGGGGGGVSGATSRKLPTSAECRLGGDEWVSPRSFTKRLSPI